MVMMGSKKLRAPLAVVGPNHIAETRRVDSLMRKAESMNLDGWSSIMTGLGIAGKDKLLDLQATWVPMRQPESEQFYSSNDICKRIANEMPDDAVREWIKFSHENAGLCEKFENEFERLGVRQIFADGLKTGRWAGGGGVLIVTDSPVENWRFPLDPTLEGGVRSLVLFSRDELNVGSYINRDVGSSRFGLPTFYQLQPISSSMDTLVTVHHSRILRFDGEPLPRRQFVQNNYWHDSVFNAQMEAIRNYNAAHLYATQAIADFSIVSLKMKNLVELMAAGKEAKVLARANTINMVKSIARMLVLDKDEEIQTIARTVTGLVDLVEKAEDRLATSTGIPRTRLFGEQAAGGLAGAGRAEERNWYDYVSRQQEIHLEPKINYLVQILELSPRGPTNGKPVGMSYEFEPLWQLSETEQAEVYTKTSAADCAYLDRNVLTAEEIRENRFMGSRYSQNLMLEDAEIDIPEPTPSEAQALRGDVRTIAEALQLRKNRKGMWEIIDREDASQVIAQYKTKAGAQRRIAKLDVFHRGASTK